MKSFTNLTREQEKILIENCFSFRMEAEEPKFNSFSYVGEEGPCHYCGEAGKTDIVYGLETCILCDDCWGREFVVDDY
jgi:hypothetical protein